MSDFSAKLSQQQLGAKLSQQGITAKLSPHQISASITPTEVTATLNQQELAATFGGGIPGPPGPQGPAGPPGPTAVSKDPNNIATLGSDSLIYVPSPSSLGVVMSVFGRTGNVVALAGDYNAAQVTNAVSTAGSYADPGWLTSLAWSKLTGVPALVTTFKNRSGAVIPATGDYVAGQVTNAVDSSASYANPAWITSLAWS